MHPHRWISPAFRAARVCLSVQAGMGRERVASELTDAITGVGDRLHHAGAASEFTASKLANLILAINTITPGAGSP